MKISLNWIFDHIKGELARIDVAQLVEKFIRTTAEIEGWKKVTLNTDELTLAQVVSIAGDKVTVRSDEYKKEYTLASRADAVIGSWFMVTIADNASKWATSTMLGGIKDMLLPALHVENNAQAGGWKSAIEVHDYIIEVDNKSINSRPDLWGHRGLAREIAAILDVPLRPLDELIIKKDIVAHDLVAHATADNPFSIAIQDPALCGRFAALYFPSVTAQASDIHMVIRLSRLDSRCINVWVDTTNYVMFDLGRPMHAFDADTLQSKKMSIGCLSSVALAKEDAKAKEKLLLIDDETIELTSEDIVITDGGKAVSLAGIMGGALTAISSNTTSVLLESANFDGTTVRRSSVRHKKRTEGSMRFEKSLDPHENIDAIERFLFLLNSAGATYKASEHIVSLGATPQPKTISIHHSFIEARLGIIIKSERIISILEKIGFNVTQSVENDVIMYNIIVPTFRATKDVKIPEDIVEEVGRYVGYDTLPRVMPSLQLYPSDLHATYTTRTIKSFLSYGLMMHELYGYSFFDESVLKELAWQPTDFVAVTNPASENYTRLVTTLQPHLLKAVAENSIHHAQLRFYEWGRVWHMHGDDIVEKKSLSGIFKDASTSEMNFYAGKALLTRLFETLHIDVTWQKYEGVEFPWLVSYQTAALIHDGKRIGVAGMVDESVKHYLSPAACSAFIFEIDGDYLLNYKQPLVRFEPLSKYPSVRRDVSILIADSVTSDSLIHTITSVDKRIECVTLIDFFSKPDWKDQKAMTFHVEIGDKEKTLVADDVEHIWKQVIAQLQQQGAVIR